MRRIFMRFAFTAVIGISAPALAWHDAAHMAVMKAAGLDNYHLAVGADMAKGKSGGYEDGNHYRDNARGVVVTADMVLDQMRDYNCRCNDDGHLYGAIISALDQYYLGMGKVDKYNLYNLGFAAHYIGDLSMPLHNTVYDDFNKANHAANDGAVEGDSLEPTEDKVKRIAAKVQEKMKKVHPYQFPKAKDGLEAFNHAVAKKIAEIANTSIALRFTLEDAKPPRTVMTEDEAYRQLAESATLLNVVLTALR